MIANREGERDNSDSLIFPWRADHSEDNDCKFHGVFYTELAAQHAVDTHQCPEPFTGWGYKFMGIAEKLWVELDSIIDKIMDSGTQDLGSADVARIQGRAGGLAYALVLCCQPYYADEKAVSKESAARWKMRNGKLDYRPTPGFKYDPPIPGTPRYKQEHLGTTDGVQVPTYTGEHNKPAEPQTSGRRRRAAVTEKQLTPMEKETIKKAGTAFPLKDLAGMYGVTEATIKSVLEEA